MWKAWEGRNFRAGFLAHKRGIMAQRRKSGGWGGIRTPRALGALLLGSWVRNPSRLPRTQYPQAKEWRMGWDSNPARLRRASSRIVGEKPVAFTAHSISTGERVADGVGFEPTRRLPAYTRSRRAPSTTRPPIRAKRAAGSLPGSRRAGGVRSRSAGLYRRAGRAQVAAQGLQGPRDAIVSAGADRQGCRGEESWRRFGLLPGCWSQSR